VDLRVELEASLVHLDAALVGAKPGEVAGLVRERRAVVTQLAALPAAEESNPVDDLSARRKNRRAAPKAGGDSASGVKRGKRSG
jgi:hypothetical protein